jgi:hypothetical protein
LLLLSSSAACGESEHKPTTADCAKACDHVLALANKELDELARQLPNTKMGQNLREQAAKAHESDLATCKSKCGTGVIDTACALAAKTLDGAMKCGVRSKQGPTAGKPIDPSSPPSTTTTTDPSPSLSPSRPATVDPAASVLDWKKEPLREVSGEVDGVKFTLKLPAKLEPDRRDPTRLSSWSYQDGPRFSFALNAMFEKNLEDAVSINVSDDGKVLHKEHKGDRYVLIFEEGRRGVRSITVLDARRKGLECKGVFGASKLSPQETGAWLAEICATVTLKP